MKNLSLFNRLRGIHWPRAALFLWASALASGGAGCALCSRDDAADGTYQLMSDCSGELRHGVVDVGASEGAEGYVPARTDGSHPVCATTSIRGAEELGLPTNLSVEGDGEFSLSGGTLDCALEKLGGEKMLFCRQGGELICIALFE